MRRPVASRAAQLVAEFHERAGLPRNVRIRPHVMLRMGAQADTRELHLLRSTLIGEESREAMDAITGWDFGTESYGRVEVANVAKELADLLVVTYGAADLWGIPLDDVLERVHESNLTKLGADQESRPDGKIVKGPHYVAPDLTDLFG